MKKEIAGQARNDEERKKSSSKFGGDFFVIFLYISMSVIKIILLCALAPLREK
jgi:hypothetical protein